MSIRDTLFWLALGAFVVALIWWARRATLESKVRDYMHHSDEKTSVKALSVILALDGHRLSKRTRDALTLWLAERGQS